MMTEGQHMPEQEMVKYPSPQSNTQNIHKKYILNLTYLHSNT